jgi:hypothetical protein
MLMTTRISNAQTFLFPVSPRDLAKQLELNWWAIKKLFDDKWLSFDPETSMITDEGMQEEFIFLGSLVGAGVDPRLLERLLNGLEKPYRYDIGHMYYDWKTENWTEIPSILNPVKVTKNLIADYAANSDIEGLIEINESVKEALNECGISTDETDEADSDDIISARYAFNPEESTVISAARKLVWSLASSPLCVEASEVITIGKLFRVLQRLPEVTLGENLRLDLSGPKRTYGTHEISHHWELRLEDSGYLVISASGHFYRPETGGDSFTTMMWQVSPENEPDEISYLHMHQLVDDADTFENEVAAMDFTESGYSLDVEDNSLEDWISEEEEHNETDPEEEVLFPPVS